MESLPTANLLSRTKAKVLIISDEPETARVWGYSLSQVGFDFQLIDVSDQPLQVWSEETPDLIILEDFNDQVEELELCKQLRMETVVPILYLTAKTSESFQVEVYRAGADECIAYPISPRLFQAKVIAWLRRTQSLPMAALDEVQVGGFRLNPSQKRLATPTGNAIRLTALEARLLFLLMSHPGTVFETELLVERVWGSYENGDTNLIKNLVYRLRRKIEPDPGQPRYLLTEGTRGYKFCTGAS